MAGGFPLNLATLHDPVDAALGVALTVSQSQKRKPKRTFAEARPFFSFFSSPLTLLVMRERVKGRKLGGGRYATMWLSVAVTFCPQAPPYGKKHQQQKQYAAVTHLLEPH